MKNYIALFAIFFFLTSCGRKKIQGDDLSISLINSQINYVDIDSILLMNSEKDDYSDLISYSKKQKIKALNVLEFRITNNSSKKYLLAINFDDIAFGGNSNEFYENQIKDSISYRRLCFFIDNKENVNKPPRDIIVNSFENTSDDSLKIYLKKYLDITRNNDFDNAIDKDDNLTVKNIFVIHPGEYRIFKKVLYLPIYFQKNSNLSLNFASVILNSGNNFEFSIGISSNKNFIWNSLPDYKRKEVIDNGYEIFDGVIISNKVLLNKIYAK